MDPRVTFTQDAHIYHYEAQQLEVVLERFSEDRKEGLFCEITVTTSLQPKPGLLHHGRVNLSSTRSRDAVVKALEERATDGWHGDTDFRGIIEYVSYRSLRRWREGEPCVDLREVDLSARPKWLIEPFVEQVGATILFADGGSGKSTVALALAVAVSSGLLPFGKLHGAPVPVLYLDWEADAYVHAERLKAICRGHGIEPEPPVYHRRQVASLMESAAAIRKDVASLGAGLVIIDSMGAARGGEPESADVTIRLFAAARSLGVPWIGIDHVTKDSGSRDKPFGSVYSHNLARRTWALEKVQEEGEAQLVIALTNKKANNGKLAKRQAYRLLYFGTEDTLESLIIEPCDVAEVPALREKVLTAKERLLVALQEGPATNEELVDRTGLDAPQVRARMKELRDAGIVTKAGERWGLLYRE